MGGRALALGRGGAVPLPGNSPFPLRGESAQSLGSTAIRVFAGAWGVGWGCPFPRTLDTPDLPGPPDLSGILTLGGGIPEWTPPRKEAQQIPKLQDHGAPSCSWELTALVPGSPLLSPSPLPFSTLEGRPRVTPRVGPPPSLLPYVGAYPWTPCRPCSWLGRTPAPMGCWARPKSAETGRGPAGLLERIRLTVSGAGQRGCPVCLVGSQLTGHGQPRSHHDLNGELQSTLYRPTPGLPSCLATAGNPSQVRGEDRVTWGLPMGQRAGTATPAWSSDRASLPSHGGRRWGLRLLGWPQGQSGEGSQGGVHGTLWGPGCPAQLVWLGCPLCPQPHHQCSSWHPEPQPCPCP